MKPTRFYLVAVAFLLACSSGSVSSPEDVAPEEETMSTDGSIDPETVEPGCGDDLCGDTESCASCPQDCGECPEVCNNNGECDTKTGETCANCEEDCGECPDPCGDDVCDADKGEDCVSCPDDCTCVAECGNDLCEAGEDPETCPEDCDTEECGNDSCDDPETCDSCPEDCGDCCGNDVCDEAFGETCADCPDDCPCPGCGDGVLQTAEGEQCDDGNNAPDDGCDEECMIEPAEAMPGDILITEIMKDPNQVQDTVGEWIELYNVTENDIDINGWTLKDDGSDNISIFHEAGVIVPAESFFVLGRESDPALNGGFDVDYVYASFNLANKDDEVILLSGAVVVDQVWYDDGDTFPDASGKSLSLDPDGFDHENNDDGVFWCDGAEIYGDGDWGTPGADNPSCSSDPVCGDGNCDEGEDEDNCPEDCGSDPCGDGDCDETENCFDCPDDCGDCCGDDSCDEGYGEDCETCHEDCGNCPGCGDGECLDGETCNSCPDDCGDCCGNDICEEIYGETCLECPTDCSCAAVCGDDQCEEDKGESCVNCAPDCGTCCGDENCNADQGENCNTCPADCDECCGNGNCEPQFNESCSTCEADCDPCPTCGDQECAGNENCFTCPGDCGNCCGNNLCEDNYQESCQNCPADCGVCCGNAVCEANFGETCFTCETDCGDCCGNNQCQANFNETCATCPSDCGACDPVCGNNDCEIGETCDNCAQDCGACPEGTWCKLWGSQGDQIVCPVELTAGTSGSPNAVTLQFNFAFDTGKASFTKFKDELCVGNQCLPLDIPASGGNLQPTGHSIASSEQPGGAIKVAIFHTSAPATPITTAYKLNGNVVGDAMVVEMVFTLAQTIAQGQAVSVVVSDIVSTDEDVEKLNIVFEDGMFITTGPGGGPFCGDGQCLGDENCQTCGLDCGVCCGDQICEPQFLETCETCALDCGPCPECGDGECNGGETCDSCEEDCGPCVASDWCNLSGSQGAEVSCIVEMAAATQAAPKGVTLQYNMTFDTSKVTFTKFKDELCVGEMCLPLDIPASGGNLQPTGHSIASSEQPGGAVKVAIFHTAAPSTPLTQAYMAGVAIVGDAEVVEMVFTLDQTVSANTPVVVTISDIISTDSNVEKLSVQFDDGLFKTSAN